MKNKYWRINIVLLIGVFLLLAGFFTLQRYFNNSLGVLTDNNIAVSGQNKLPKEIKEISGQQFNFALFATPQFKQLKEYFKLPIEVNNKHNSEPFK